MVSVLVVNRIKSIKLLHRVKIEGVYTCPDYRTLGLSKKLFYYAIETLKNDSTTKQIEIGVETTNIIAKEFYDKLGFIKYGTEKNAIFYNEKFYDVDLMYLEI